MTISRLQQLVQEDLEKSTAILRNKIQHHPGLINNLSSHILNSGGKRLRPLTVLLASHACNYQGNDHITLAAMIECIHTATLLHDDVVDESSMRRGNQTANTIWGAKASILVGDYLLTEYIQMITRIGNIPIMQLLADTLHQISCGEIKQLENRFNELLTESEYFEIICAKTSLLFATSACLGAMISNASETIQKGLYNFGIHLGNAFQLIDDALDYSSDSDTLGKNIGDDLATGHLTLPLLYALRNCSEEKTTQIQAIFKKGTIDNLSLILEVIEETNAIAYTKSKATIELDHALSALQVLPDSLYKTALGQLAQYAISRNH